MTATGTPRHEGSTGRQGFGSSMGEQFKSGLLDVPPYLSIYIYYVLRTNVCRWSRYLDKYGAYRRWRTYSAMYGDLVEVFNKAKAGTLPPHQSVERCFQLR
jgi:hypothetical protein